MDSDWGSLPLLPLRCVLENLNTADALAAMSTCRHWRSAMHLYEGHKDALKLRVKQMDKNILLTRLFKRHIKKLHIYVNSNKEDLDYFMNHILLQYLDTHKLHELIFIGPTYLLQNKQAPIVRLNRVLTESLMLKHADCLHRLMMLGCELSPLRNEVDSYSQKLVEQYAKPLHFTPAAPPADAYAYRSNIVISNFTALHFLTVDYELINNVNVETLSELRLSQLTLNVGLRRVHRLPRVCWPRDLRVAVNVINVPQRKMHDVMHSILTEGLYLVSLKVMFCKTLYAPMINHVVRLFKATLQELVWVDSPYEADPSGHIDPDDLPETEFDTTNVNPLILLCWQCIHLRRLVLHGYWIWQYELVGLVRLRKSLEALEVSAVYERSERFGGGMMRVHAHDRPRPLHETHLQQVNDYTGFLWRPCPWDELHPGLRAGSTPAQRACYVLRECAVR
ncbi:uncharacterized protein LOC121728061 [Aricia agestis]|uniref:uncharacterized protein LOC121728061 n=1 Tax=Aricia agestis TaxID=91739 RepID=UPI001C209200|nr:uncharacterized protein LOC121728061 [Aricia agestis]